MTFQVFRKCCALATFMLVVGVAHAPAQVAIKMTDVTAQSGIDFVHTNGVGGEAYIIEGMASGMATFDYDNDGWIDNLLLGWRTTKRPIGRSTIFVRVCTATTATGPSPM